ncbi:MAG: urea transporter, partial [Proteobacteria bacterium]|nr:urea transporter [Pseudomonadota bacterium]
MKSAITRAVCAFVSAQISSTGLAIGGTSFPQRLLGFVDSVLRGIGQVMLQDNSYTGLLFVIGIFFNSILFGWAVLLGTTASTATAMLLGVDRSHLRAGLFGF